MTQLHDAIPNARLMLRRGQESLWLQESGAGPARYVTLNGKSQVDYPLRLSDGRVVYDWPERLSKPFRKMVHAEMNKAVSQ